MREPTLNPSCVWPCNLSEIPTLQAPENWPVPTARFEFVRLYRRAMTALRRAEFLLGLLQDGLELAPDAMAEVRRQQREVLDEIKAIFELVELRADPDHDQMTLDELMSEDAA